MTSELIATLCDHAQGNLRALMNIAGELLAAAEGGARQIDEKLFFQTCAVSPAAAAARRRRRRSPSSPPSALPIAPWIRADWSPGCRPMKPSASSAATQNGANPSLPSISPLLSPPAPLPAPLRRAQARTCPALCRRGCFHIVRPRLDGICAAARLAIADLDVQVITAPSSPF
jgi:hypothetical protein